MGHIDSTHQPTHAIRDQTAELASYALSEAANSYQSRFSPGILASPHSNAINGEIPPLMLPPPSLRPMTIDQQHEFGPITEESEPASPDLPSSGQKSRTSHLTHLLRTSPPQAFQDERSHENPSSRHGERPLLNERVSLLSKGQQSDSCHTGYNTMNGYHHDSNPDVESQNEDGNSAVPKLTITQALTWPKTQTLSLAKTFFPHDGVHINKKDLFRNIIVKPAGYLPAVVLGLLLNVLDGLSYGL